MLSGETDKAVSVIDARFQEVGETIGKNLKHIGNLDGDVFEHQGELYFLELNPRFGGGYPFSHEAGNNTAAIYLAWLKCQSDVAQYSNYQENIMYAKYDRSLRVN